MIDFAALGELVNRAVSWLQEHGIGRCARIAVLTPNDPLAMVAAIAVLHVGSVWIPINPRDSAIDIASNLDRARCDVLLYGDSVAALVTEVRRSTRTLRVVGRLPALVDRSPTVASRPSIAANTDDLAAIFFTGGTTGRPKGVMFHHGNVMRLVEGYLDLSLRDGDVQLASGPLTHVAGRQCLAALAGGIPTVILPAFEPGSVLRAIERHRVTVTTMTPTMLYKLLDHPAVRESDISSLRRLGYGAAPIALDRLKQALHLLGPVMQGGYGQTESPMLIASLLPEEHFRDITTRELADDARLMSVGRPTKYSDVRIIGEDGTELHPGETGEIVVAGDYQMSGYLDDPATTAKARWGRHVRTGDLGLLDAEGYLTIRGRRKDMIITGGFNVYAAEVESALAEHPGVAEAAVFGLPDELWGESVNAAVAPRAGETIDADELRRWARARLGGVKAPKRIVVLSDLPRNSNGKILKRQLVEQFTTGNPAEAAG